MAKQQKQKKKGKQVKQEPIPVPVQSNSLPFIFDNFNIQAIIIAVVGIAIYFNSTFNEYALDDGIVIQKNEYVQQGFSGIGKILTKDAYASFYEQMGAGQQLQGGRYRPLSIVTFAIEHALFGSEDDLEGWDIAGIRHVGNVILYVLSVIILLYFLRNYIFKEHTIIAFMASFLFLIHPMHTEVVANVKSRDEIMSILFIVLTFISVMNYREQKNTKDLLLGMFYYFLACLSKEYAITLVVLIPMLLFIAKGDSIPESIQFTIPIIVVAALYLLIRFKIVGAGASGESEDVLNAPFKFTRGNERIATKIEILNHYLRLLFYPHPLSSDYSYNTIPYKNFGDGLVWLSLITHLTMVGATVKLFFKRNILSFALAFYLLNLALICNIFMEVGATMGERLVYHSSIGFVMAIAIGFHWLLMQIKKEQIRNICAIAVGLVVTIWSADKVIARNAEWKNDTVLFRADVKTVPNSVLVNGNVGKAYYDLSETPEYKGGEEEKELLRKSLYHLNKAVSIHPKYVNGYINLGVVYYKQQNLEKAKENWDIVAQLYPNNPYLLNNNKALGAMFFQRAMRTAALVDVSKEQLINAIADTKNANELTPSDEYRAYLVVFNFMLENYGKGEIDWIKFVQFNPHLKFVVANFCYQMGMGIASQKNKPKSFMAKGIKPLEYAVTLNPNENKYRCDLGGIYYMMEDYGKAAQKWQEVLQKDPQHKKALESMKLVERK